jgi:hypothetical protein
VLNIGNCSFVIVDRNPFDAIVRGYQLNNIKPDFTSPHWKTYALAKAEAYQKMWPGLQRSNLFTIVNMYLELNNSGL